MASEEESMFRRSHVAAALLLFAAATARAVTVDELIAKNVEARGGIEKLRSIQSLRTSGKMFIGDGGFSVELGYVQMVKRPGMFRGEASLQGMTAVSAYDGHEGWQIQPFGGRLDPEKMSADDVKGLKLLSDLDGPLVDYQAKGYKVEYLGTEDVDGTDAHKLKVTLKDGDVLSIYLDPDYFLQIRSIVQYKIRGVEVVEETDWGNYEQVGGVMLPFSIESGPKDQPKPSKLTIEKAEINIPLDAKLFRFPASPATVNK
jgi:outer membrane lipoprotein-sorting protein